MSDEFGKHFRPEVPPGDNRERHVCGECGFIHYVNPKIVVGSVVHHEDRLLLCRRSIEPRRGYWTPPAGFLEQEETTEEGALREAREEANAELEIDGFLGIYNIPRISQVQLFYRARLVDGRFSPGDESLETELFEWDDIPWDELAFPSVSWALERYREVRGKNGFAPFTATG